MYNVCGINSYTMIVRLYVEIIHELHTLSYGSMRGTINFVRGGPALKFFWFMRGGGGGGSKYHFERAIIGPQAKFHLNGVSLAYR